MKTLLLLRHAKSVKGDATLRDFDRPLSDRGRADARLIGTSLKEKQIVPDLILSSPARRARKTAELVLKAARLKSVPEFEARIYDASLHQLLTVVSELEPSSKVVMLVGHNPGFEQLLAALTGEIMPLPTCALASIDLQISDWAKAGVRAGKLRWLVTPKDLKREETT